VFPCFGAETWAREVPVPQGWIEFDVDDVLAATAEFTAHGYQVLVVNKTEPWGQTVSRLLGPEGLLVGVTHTTDVRHARRAAARECALTGVPREGGRRIQRIRRMPQHVVALGAFSPTSWPCVS